MKLEITEGTGAPWPKAPTEGVGMLKEATIHEKVASYVNEVDPVTKYSSKYYTVNVLVKFTLHHLPCSFTATYSASDALDRDELLQFFEPDELKRICEPRSIYSETPALGSEIKKHFFNWERLVSFNPYGLTLHPYIGGYDGYYTTPYSYSDPALGIGTIGVTQDGTRYKVAIPTDVGSLAFSDLGSILVQADGSYTVIDSTTRCTIINMNRRFEEVFYQLAQGKTPLEILGTDEKPVKDMPTPRELYFLRKADPAIEKRFHQAMKDSADYALFSLLDEHKARREELDKVYANTLSLLNNDPEVSKAVASFTAAMEKLTTEVLRSKTELQKFRTQCLKPAKQGASLNPNDGVVPRVIQVMTDDF